MKTEDVIRYFGSKSKVARAVGIRVPSIDDWRETVPWMRQIQIEKLTKGKLKHDPRSIPARMREYVRVK